MHELSIAQSLIELANETAGQHEQCTVNRLNLRIGVLSGVYAHALQFSFEVAAEGTCCEGAELVIVTVPVSVRCSACNEIKTLVDPYHFVCPDCLVPTSEIVGGRELDFVSMEIESLNTIDSEAADGETTNNETTNNETTNSKTTNSKTSRASRHDTACA